MSCDIKILQIGYPKSGNYWLYKIIQEALGSAGVKKKNFIQNHPVYTLASGCELSYPEQVDVNMMDILHSGCFFRISSIFRKRIGDVKNYVNGNTHVWTHSNYCAMSEQVFPLFDKIVYIVRDPRDIALSKADFAFTPYMKKHYPTRHRSPLEYLEAEALDISREWKLHVEQYLDVAARHNILILFYEHLLQNFDQELELLLGYLGYSFTEKQLERIAVSVSSDQMRKHSPQHVRKARHYKWMRNMSRDISSQILTETKDLLEKLNYPFDHAQTKLPQWRLRDAAKRATGDRQGS